MYRVSQIDLSNATDNEVYPFQNQIVPIDVEMNTLDEKEKIQTKKRAIYKIQKYLLSKLL